MVVRDLALWLLEEPVVQDLTVGVVENAFELHHPVIGDADIVSLQRCEEVQFRSLFQPAYDTYCR